VNTADDAKKINSDKRPIKSFEAEDDVAQMLDKAKRSGLVISEICNRALKKHGLAIIREILNERHKLHQEWETLDKQQAKSKAVSQSSAAIRLAQESGKKQTTESPSENKPSRASSGHGNRR